MESKLVNNIIKQTLVLQPDTNSIGECLNQLNRFFDDIESSEHSIIMHIDVVTENEQWLPAQIEEMSTLYPKWEKCIGRLEKLKNVKIVSCPNKVSQFALELLFVADYRVASNQAGLNLAAAQFDIIPTTFIYRAAHLLGDQQAKKLFLFGQSITANEGVNIGLYDELSDSAAEVVERVVNTLTPTLLNQFSIRRRLIADSHNQSIGEALGSHLAACDRLFALGENDFNKAS
ncbi:enoyl-CoA hydratase-related protein [Pseudoalteromonas umbrosa]|uniref:enoyl-CoA hydratase-related protein n=1 Tax=Pseudoalteromonas umbrosa TaxID=3048489 RepID=UPI0024C3A55F|nr:enoyl-CoA hydratase-related protein [Pseudoalteromonas sp. B95]MDK1288839.1 enoyl-CoA hydratase-related protein [Pseudoalteromonas sp. B95]